MADWVEFRQLRCFIAVAEELNFTQAAQRLSLSQPIVSRIIKELETEIGVQLFVRDRRHVTLTAAGEAFLLESRKVLVQLKDAVDTVAGQQVRAQIRVGLGAVLAEHLADVFMRYEECSSAASLELYDMGSSLQNEALCNGSLDVGFLRPPIDQEHLSSEFLFRENILVLLPKKHPLALRKSVRLPELSKERLLLHQRHLSVGMYDKILQLFQECGIEPRALETKTGPYEDAGRMLVARGKGIFLISDSQNLGALNEWITAVPLAEPNAYFEVHMVWRTEETSERILHFIDSIRREFVLTSYQSSRRKSSVGIE